MRREGGTDLADKVAADETSVWLTVAPYGPPVRLSRAAVPATETGRGPRRRPVIRRLLFNPTRPERAGRDRSIRRPWNSSPILFWPLPVRTYEYDGHLPLGPARV